MLHVWARPMPASPLPAALCPGARTREAVWRLVRWVLARSDAGRLAPEALLEAADTRRRSRFFDPRIGDVPVCFLSDGDTTGGNSGSPVINGKGELVGLNFDRVFENVSGDYGWNEARSRNISVDVRFVLWFLEAVQPAPHLLAEMGVMQLEAAGR